jgi:predicted ATP-dependent endonuclease of OLD family
MSEHFLTDIKIKEYKLFQDFKADNFGRVNLIGGKNNVGKTAFMEACYLETAPDTIELYSRLLEIDTHRNIINNLLYNRDKKTDIEKLIRDNLNFVINQTKISLNKNSFTIEIDTIEEKQTYDFSKLVELLDLSLVNAKSFYSIHFIGQDTSPDWLLNHLIGKSKLEDRYNTVNNYLSEVFGVQNIDIIDNLPYIKKEEGTFIPLHNFGQGIKSFIDILLSLILSNNSIIFIDEIENGIHHTNFDKLWEIILTISKQQNIQVFATTHSKECIESYARVADKLEEDEIRFISLYKDNENIQSIVFNKQEIDERLELGLDNR